MTRTRNAIAMGAAAACVLVLGGCSTLAGLNPFGGEDKNKTVASAGERISIIAFDQTVAAEDSLKGADFYLPGPQPLAEWRLPGGAPEQSIEHVEAGAAFDVAWRRGFGKGSNKRVHVTAPPISAGGVIFVMDAEAAVSAMRADDGGQVWRVDLDPETRRDREAFGGGLAFADGKVFVTSGYRFVAALDAATGALLWRTMVEAPIHAAPTVVGTRVLAVSTDNQLQTFDTATGRPDWTYQALVEPARILAASSPAAEGDTVVASFGSGELIALRAANGNDLWAQSLSRASRTNALSEIRDIAGRPIIYRGDVYAASHSGVFAATDLRTGAARWSLPVSSITSPWASGDVVWVVSKAGEVICVNRTDGKVYWISDLNAGRKKKQRAVWSGVILASNRLISVSSTGEAVALDPKTGAIQQTLKLGGPALMTPIAVGGTVYVATDEAQLVAIR